MNAVWDSYVSKMTESGRLLKSATTPNPIRQNLDYTVSNSNSSLEKPEASNLYGKGVDAYKSYMESDSEEEFKRSIDLLSKAYDLGSVNAAHYLSEIYYTEGDYEVSNMWLDRAITLTRDEDMDKKSELGTESAPKKESAVASEQTTVSTPKTPMESLLRLARELKRRGDYEALCEVSKVISRLADEQQEFVKCDECHCDVSQAESKSQGHLCKACFAKPR
jgi:tetratricopeptide (TPR) repeat protein